MRDDVGRVETVKYCGLRKPTRLGFFFLIGAASAAQILPLNVERDKNLRLEEISFSTSSSASFFKLLKFEVI